MTASEDQSLAPSLAEEKLAGLVELLSDWYWEQDEEFRFTVMTGKGLQNAHIDPRLLMGTRRWDGNRTAVSLDGSWERHRAMLEAHQPFTNFIYKTIRAKDRAQYLSTSGEPIFDAGGRFRGYRGIGKDVTQQVQLEMRRTIEHAVTRILASSEDVAGCMSRIIQVICETLGWTCGAHWRVDEARDMLCCAESWSVASFPIEEFLQAGRHEVRVDKTPAGLIRAAWATGEPVWLRDVVQEPTFRRAATAAKAGLHSAFAFPIRRGTKVIGVMEMFSRDIHRPDPDLLVCVGYVGDQISQFLQLVQARRQLRQSEERYRSLTELSSDWLWEQDADFRTTFIDGAMKEKAGLDPEARMGKFRWDLPALNMTQEDWARHRMQLEQHEPFHELELQLRDLDGNERWISISGRPVFDAQGRFCGYRGIGKDISARKVTEERIQYLATHDGLTGLPNRALFNKILQLAINTSRRYKRKFAVLFIDLDRFKLINDTLGHDAGDLLLTTMSTRLTECLRTSDVVARLGGDEFVVLLQEVDEERDVAAVADKILSVVMKPVVLHGQECRVTTSIGICMFPSHAQDEQSLMKNADVAMYRAKDEGKNNYRFYSEDIRSQSLERLALESSLRHAVERQEFFLLYQAKLDLKTGMITGVEALLRWNHPELGIVPPLQFIPLAEETGLIIPIGRWVMAEACRQNVAWQKQGFPPLCMAINLSGCQFADDSLPDSIADALAQSGMDPTLLELELTESMVIQHPDRASRLLATIKSMGVRLAIDDFGTGYSSLAQLKRFPIDTLKVDRSFIRDIPGDAEDKAITKAIIAMGKTLSLTVVAEGVETEEQVEFLRSHACDEIQGFHFSKPIAPESFAEFWRQHRQSR
ncbi:MAG TPA: EAL domain-containing protein [Noviherbaspirillum sp.]|uniref:sensor domain-containing protein n=1 Tax=Noviherbaspirillum sp. TaxID=1926288 RepID=UPI002DDCAEAE|nr:EAL domain-containing protein [Noviherbaspirillum sp.]HEV2610740.1 EAL domain-containing protein [Noviherbaspirillum sp.]